MNSENSLDKLSKLVDIPKNECRIGINSNICLDKDGINLAKKKVLEIHTDITEDKMNNMSSDELIIFLLKKLNCKNQKELIELLNLDKIKYIKIEGPANSTDLLNNINIDSVLKQYEITFPFF